jgi:hypothetical protein
MKGGKMLPGGSGAASRRAVHPHMIGRVAMSVSLPRIAVLSLAALLGFGVTETFAQRMGLAPGQQPPTGTQIARPVFYPPFLRPQIKPFFATQFTPQSVAASQFAYNASLVGAGLSAIPPYAFGYPPLGGGPIVAPSPYGISTVGGYNPYGAGTGALSTSPYGGYSLSTTPYGSYGSPYSNYGYGYQDPFGSVLQGLASVTAATGQYYQQIQQARITREQSRQMALDTQRKQIEFEMWYESVRPTAPKLIAKENETNLDEARNYPSATKIWSGDALNQLLRAAIKSGRLNRGPNVPLEEDNLKHINLTDRSSRGNVGLLKDGGKLQWPLVLKEAQFDETTTKLGLEIQNAVQHLKEKQPVPVATLRDADTLFKTLTDKLNDSADDMSPAQYIEAKRYLNQVGNAIRALKDPKAGNFFNNTWNAKGKTVAELVDHMNREGLEFAPATSGDEAAYRSLYNALRSFESGIQASQNR